MDEKRIRCKIDLEAYKRMMANALVLVYNDILNSKDYTYSLHMVIKHNSIYYQKKLKRHYGAINWLMNESRNSLCFAILGLSKIQNSTVINSILKKFNSNTKFIKTIDDFLKTDEQKWT